jgi:hypothetical protein
VSKPRARRDNGLTLASFPNGTIQPFPSQYETTRSGTYSVTVPERSAAGEVGHCEDDDGIRRGEALGSRTEEQAPLRAEQGQAGGSVEAKAELREELMRHQAEVRRHAEQLIGRPPDPHLTAEWMRERLDSARYLEKNAESELNDAVRKESESQRFRDSHWEYITNKGDQANKYDYMHQDDYNLQYRDAKISSREAAYSLGKLKARRMAIQQAIQYGFPRFVELNWPRPQEIGSTVTFAEVFRHYLESTDSEARRKFRRDFVATMAWGLLGFVLLLLLTVAFGAYCVSYFRWVSPLAFEDNNEKYIQSTPLYRINILICTLFYLFTMVVSLGFSLDRFRSDDPGLALGALFFGVASLALCAFLVYGWAFDALTAQTYRSPQSEILRNALGFSSVAAIMAAAFWVAMLWYSINYLYQLRYWKPDH